MTPFPQTEIGECFPHAGRMWRRGRGRYYVAHPSSLFLTVKWLGRVERRRHRKVSPSTARFERRHGRRPL